MKFPNLLLNKTWKGVHEFKKLSKERRNIVFYAENKASINHFRSLITELTERRKLEICYVSSVENDPLLKTKNTKIKSFYIGSGSARTHFFLTLEAKVLLMDMPDLENFHIKRSKVCPVHYIYIFHSMFSTHTYLRKEALFHFDTIFCVGPHHINEIKKSEEIYNLKPKNLIDYGFGRLDELLLKKRNTNLSNIKKTILIVPTYGENNLLIKCGKKLIQILLENNFRVILRPHFRILSESKQLIRNIEEDFKNNENFVLERGIISQDLFENSTCLITDWSGISFEYAFVFEKTVIFLDLPQKILNPDYKELSIEPMEIENRNEIGHIVSINNLEKIVDILNNNEFNNLQNRIKKIRSSTIFNIGNSSKKGADFIQKILSP